MKKIVNFIFFLSIFLFSSAHASIAELQKMRDCALGIERSAVFQNMLKSQDTVSATTSEKGFYIDIEESKASCRFTFLGEQSVDSVQLQRKSSRDGATYLITLSNSDETFFVNVPMSIEQPCKVASSNDFGDTKKSARATSLLTDKSKTQFAAFFKAGIVGQFADLTKVAVSKLKSTERKNEALAIEGAIKSCRQIKEFSEEISKVDKAFVGDSSTGAPRTKKPQSVQ